MKGKIEIWCQREPFCSDISLLVTRNDKRSRAVGDPVTMREQVEAGLMSDPTMTLTNSEAQHLMDQLWNCGLRPSEGSGSAGSLAATERHLADMRHVARGALKKCGIEAPL